MNLDVVDALSVIKNTSEKAKKIAEYASEILKLADNIALEGSMLPEEGIGGEPDDPDALMQLLQRIENAMVGIRANIFLSYWALSAPETLGGKLTYFEAVTSDFQEKYCSCFEISAKVQDDRLLVKLPLLWSRYNYHAKNMRYYSKSSDYLGWFNRELDAALLKISDEIPSYLSRHFSFVHVIPKNRKNVADNDNYDTKHVVDLITTHLIGTDGPLHNSFSYFSTVEDPLPVGSYVVLTPGFGNPPPLAKLVTWLLEVDFATIK